MRSAKFVSTVWLSLLLAAVVCGCVTSRKLPPLAVTEAAALETASVEQARRTVAKLVPPQYRAVQRAVIRVGSKQFTCDGVLSASATGYDLALVSNLGVVTAVRASHNGDVEVRQVTPLFREDWARQFVARDLRWLFVPPPELVAAGRMADGRMVLQTKPTEDGMVARYVFDNVGRKLEMMELVRQGRSCWRAEVTRYRTFGGVGETPAEFRVHAGSYQLDLRIVDLALPATSAPQLGGARQ